MSQNERKEVLLAFGLLLFFLIHIALFRGFIVDDAFIDLRFFKVTVTTPIRYIGSKKAIRQSPFPFVPEKR